MRINTRNAFGIPAGSQKSERVQRARAIGTRSDFLYLVRKDFEGGVLALTLTLIFLNFGVQRSIIQLILKIQHPNKKMNTFTLISSLILFGLAFLCFFLPFKNGQRKVGYVIGLTLGFVITFTLIGNLDFLIVFIWPLIVIFQIIFISYWTFRVFNRRGAGQIVAVVLTITFLLLLMQPWISDWTFNKKDVIKILTFHNIELREDFKILRNEAGGFRDYYETFTIKLSDNDFYRISQTIKTSRNFKGVFTDYTNLPAADHRNNDTVDFETDNHFEREYWTITKMDNGTCHFRFELDKQSKELNYTGSDE